MNSHTPTESNNLSSVDSTKKEDGNVPNVSDMEDTGLQYCVGIDAMFSKSAIHQYTDMEHNNESFPPLINGTMSSFKNSQFQHLLPPLLVQ